MGIVYDFEQGFHDVGDLVVLVFCKFTLFSEVFDGLGAVLEGHGDEVFLIAHLCITYYLNDRKWVINCQMSTLVDPTILRRVVF